MSSERESAYDAQCVYAKDHLGSYLDNELPPEVHVRVREHLAGCPMCRGEVRAIQQIKALVRRSCRETAPPALRMRIQQQVTVWSTDPRRRPLG